MLYSIRITLFSWIISFFVLINIPSTVTVDFSIDGLISMVQKYNTEELIWHLGLLLPALIAPILTYRLTGYCFDSDFSLPPWSHGRWGFGKPAPAQATTQASSDETGPNASPPTSTGGGG